MLCCYMPASAQEDTQQKQKKAAEEQSERIDEEMPIDDTLMFSSADVENLDRLMRLLEQGGDRASLADAKKGLNEPDILAEILRRAEEKERLEEEAAVITKEIEKQKKQYSYPDFYVSTIVYHSEKNWAVWVRVNDIKPRGEANKPKAEETEKKVGDFKVVELDGTPKKIEPQAPRLIPRLDQPSEPAETVRLTAATPQDNESGLTVEAITPGAVTLSYQPTRVQHMVERLSTKGTDSDRLELFNSRFVKDREVMYNKDGGRFTAVLQPNQTFSTDMMRIVEGRTVAPYIKAPRNILAENNRAAEQRRMPAPDDPIKLHSIEADLTNELIKNVNQLRTMSPRDIQP